MKLNKVLFAALLSISSICYGYSQQRGNTESLFQFSLFPRLGTNGPLEKEYTNTISINLTVGVSNNENAFSCTGLANIIRNNAQGLQIAGATNYVGNGGNGVLLSGLVNIVGNNYNGLQITGGANHAQNTSGVQIAGLYNAAKNVEGVQIAAGANHAKDIDGLQVAGLYNVAKDVKGVQLAIVNVAENNNCPIGLVNIIKNGEKGLSLSYDMTGSAVLTFRSGGKYTYGIIGVGYNHKVSNNPILAECGIGAHIPCCSWFRINNELKIATIGTSSQKPVLNTGYSLLPGFKIGKHVELFGGVNINYMTTSDINNNTLFTNHALWEQNSGTQLQQVYIGYQVGIQYIF